MAKDNIIYLSLITLNKIFTSNINKDIVDESIISNQLVFESPIGIESIIVDYSNGIVSNAIFGETAIFDFDVIANFSGGVVFTVDWGVEVGTTIINANLVNSATQSLQTSILIPEGVDPNQVINVHDSLAGTYQVNYTVESGIPIPTDGLIAYYPYNGNTNDESGNGHNLTNTDAVLTADRDSNPDSAYQFNGTTAWMTNANSGLNLDPFTVCFWYKADAFLNHQIFIGKTSLASFGSGWAVEYNAGKINFFINHWLTVGPSTNHVQIATTDTTSWHFVCASYDPSLGSENLKLQLDNNTPVTADLDASVNYSGTTFSIGKGAGINFMQGKMDDFAYYNRELTPEEITTIFNL